MKITGVISATNISAKKGTAKHNVNQIIIDAAGVVADAHAGPGHRQVSLLSQESIDAFAAQTGIQVAPGAFGENLTISGIDLTIVAIHDRFKIGTVELEVTQIGKECHGNVCAIFRTVGKCIMPQEGLFTKVLRGGTINVGDAIELAQNTRNPL